MFGCCTSASMLMCSMSFLGAYACRGTKCPKNHIEHFTEVVTNPATGLNEHTKKATFIFIHHKNSSRQGKEELPASQQLVEPLALLEKAARVLGSASCPTLIIKKKEGHEDQLIPYHELDPTFSSTCTKLLSSAAMGTINAVDVRHAFSTAWRNFQQSPVGQQYVTKLIEAAAAAMCGNTSAAWDATYDDEQKTRGMHQVLVLWPRFTAWVKASAALKRHNIPRNPHA